MECMDESERFLNGNLCRDFVPIALGALAVQELVDES